MKKGFATHSAMLDQCSHRASWSIQAGSALPGKASDTKMVASFKGLQALLAHPNILLHKFCCGTQKRRLQGCYRPCYLAFELADSHAGFISGAPGSLQRSTSLKPRGANTDHSLGWPLIWTLTNFFDVSTGVAECTHPSSIFPAEDICR